MRRATLAFAFLLVAAAATFGGATKASADTYPVCLAGGDENSLRCDYANIEECRTAASGGLRYCVTNPTDGYRMVAEVRSANDFAIDRDRRR